MIEAARQRKFQIILCKTQSRFTRDMELVEKYIHGMFPIWGIRFIAVADNADTEVKGNKKARQINGLVNEWYLEDLSENVRMVFDLKRREGQYIGGFPVYGYKKHPTDKNRIVIDPEAAAVVRQIFQWSLEGHGRQNIAHMLNERGVANPARYKAEHGWACGYPRRNDCGLWSKTAVYRILRNEMYTGVMIQGRRKKVSYKSKVIVDMPEDKWFRVEGTHEPIIDCETFQAVQQGLRLRTRAGGAGQPHILAGLVKCMDCGSTMSKCSNGDHSYLRCSLYAGGGSKRSCTRHSIRLDRLIDAVSERIRYYVHTCFSLDDLDIQPQKDVRKEALEREQKSVSVQLEKRSRALKALYLDKVSGILSEGQFIELNQSFSEEKSRLERRLAELSRELAAYRQPRQQADLMAKAQALLKLETLPRELAVMLIEKIEVGESDPAAGQQEVRITWKF